MTRSIALLFPGQGSQYVGMGRSLVDTPFEKYLDRADHVLGYSLKQMMLEGPEKDLTLTQNAQPAILAYSTALFYKLSEFLKNENIIERVLGHSVGEYAALTAAGSLSYDDALVAVHKRGLYMQEAVAEGVGAMYAILKVPKEMVERACGEVGGVTPANYNSPEQIVISGGRESCEKAVAFIKDHHSCPFKAVKLHVSAPFHCSLMKPAAERLKDYLKNLSLRLNNISYIANVNACEYPIGTCEETIKDNLYKQVWKSVLWSQSFQTLADGLICLECGPGRVLTGLAKKIRPTMSVLPLDKKEDFGELL